MQKHGKDFEEFRPRLIMWQLNPEPDAQVSAPDGNGERVVPFSTHECLLTIDSISRTSKPIVVFTGSNLLRRPDLYDIVEYGVALGLKMIIETKVQALSDDILKKYSVFGPRVFRILLDECIIEDMDSRYKKSSAFLALEQRIRQLKKSGYEIHLGVTITDANVRDLAFKHDYAFRRSANGLYCDLRFEDTPSLKPPSDDDKNAVDGFIESIAKMKCFSPRNMYFSPQCVKYGLRDIFDDTEEDISENIGDGSPKWRHWCVGGRSFAFIGPEGVVRMCAASPLVCGELRANGYNFRRIWDHSEVFKEFRIGVRSCSETRTQTKNIEEVKSPDTP